MIMDLSIIIPVYNTELYVEKCIMSAVNQDIDAHRYEILVVNDGSPDSSAEIVERIAATYPNVTLLTKENGGLSSARNYGLERAKGDYVMFIDSDDYYMPNMFSSVIENMRQDDLDMMEMAYQAVDEHGEMVEFGHSKWFDPKPLTPVIGNEYLLTEAAVVMIALYCYRRAFLNDNNLRFAPLWHEDELFTHCALALCRSVKYNPAKIYNYLIRSDSFTGNYKPVSVLHRVKIAAMLRNFAQDVVTDSQVKNYLYLVAQRLLYQSLERSENNGFDMELTLLKEAKKMGLLPLPNPHKSSRLFMMNHMPRLYLLRRRLTNKK